MTFERNMKINLQTLLTAIAATLIAFLTTRIQALAINPVVTIVALIAAALVSYILSDLLIPIANKRWSLFRRDGDFGFKIDGMWWQWVDLDNTSTLSLIQLRYLPSRRTVEMTGTAFACGGNIAARWRSISSCMDDDRLEVFYHWSGEQVAKQEESITGIGVLKFLGTDTGIIRSGSGYFSELFMGSSVQTKRTFSLERASNADTTLSDEQLGDLIVAKIQKRHECSNKGLLRTGDPRTARQSAEP